MHDTEEPDHTITSKRRTLNSSRFVVCLGALILGAATAFLLLRDQIGSDVDTSPPGNATARTPNEAIEVLFQASHDRDCGDVVDILTEGSWHVLLSLPSVPDFQTNVDPLFISRSDAVEICETRTELFEGELLNIRPVDAIGTTARLDVTEVFHGEVQTERWTVVRQGSGWKVDLVATVGNAIFGVGTTH